VSKLETILQEEAIREINQILAEAEEKARALLAEAEAKAAQIKAAAERRLEAEKRAALARAESAAELKVATARMKARGEMIERVKRMVAERLQGMGADPRYPEILERLAEEAVAAVSEPGWVAVAPEDAGHLEAWAKERGVELKTDPEVRLGVRVYTKGGDTYVENTLPGRLERAWEELASKVAQVLWG